MKKRRTSSIQQMVGAGALCAGGAAALAAGPDVIYSELASDPTGTVPGALDGAGSPVVTNWMAIEDLAVSHDGTHWCIKGRTTQATTNDSILILGSATSGTMFLQDGQPVQGGAAGELWDFFDSPNPISWDDNGNIGFSARAKNGLSAVKEKVVRVVSGVHTILFTESSPATGLTDVVANPTGDELIGNSVGSVQLRIDGTVFLCYTPIQNCHSSRYPALFLSTAGFKQSGVSTIGFETWDSFVLDGAGCTPDGAHWFAEGDTENPSTTIDGLLVVDDVVVMREGSALAGTGIIAADVFFTRMITTGDWFSRGDDTADNDWAMRNGVVIAATGDPITTPLVGPTENWGNAFSAFHGNSKGDWVLAGNTTNVDLNADNVLVLNGDTIVAREGDAVDVNGNGQADDNAFIAGFQPNDLFLTDEMMVHVLVTLRNGAGTSLGDAYLQYDLAPIPPACPSDIAPRGGNGTVNVNDLLAVINGWGACADPCPPSCVADVNGDCNVNVNDLLAVINAWGNCP